MVAEALEATDARNIETLLCGLTFVRDMLMPELEAPAFAGLPASGLIRSLPGRFQFRIFGSWKFLVLLNAQSPRMFRPVEVRKGLVKVKPTS